MPPLHGALCLVSSIGVGRKFDPCGRQLDSIVLFCLSFLSFGLGDIEFLDPRFILPIVCFWRGRRGVRDFI
jgi:hypothetical protein